MELYNSLIRDTEAQLEKLDKKAWDYSPADCWKDTGSSELVLQRDAAYELGAQGRGSANYVLFTSSAELVSEDKVILIGPDMGQIKGECDFARIVLLQVGVLDDDDEAVYRTLKDIEFSKYHVYPEGYMIRMSPESSREQVRVSKQALRKGISFKTVGNRYVAAAIGGLKTVVVGLIGAGALLLVNEENFIDYKSVLIFLAAFVLTFKFKMDPILMLVLAGAAGYFLYG